MGILLLGWLGASAMTMTGGIIVGRFHVTLGWTTKINFAAGP